MKMEKWQDLDDILVRDNDKAIICEFEFTHFT